MRIVSKFVICSLVTIAAVVFIGDPPVPGLIVSAAEARTVWGGLYCVSSSGVGKTYCEGCSPAYPVTETILTTDIPYKGMQNWTCKEDAFGEYELIGDADGTDNYDNTCVFFPLATGALCSGQGS